MLIEKIHWLGYAAFCIESSKRTVLYFDPYELKRQNPKADIILISHDHYDHCDENSIKKIIKPETIIVGPPAVKAKLPFDVMEILPNQEIAIKGLEISTIPAYNIDKQFHPKQNNHLGFVVTIDGERVYHAGDTDIISEMENIKADIALLPIGGTYTMSAKEAAEAAKLINPKTAVPMHYGLHVGKMKDSEEFKKLCLVPVKILKIEK